MVGIANDSSLDCPFCSRSLDAPGKIKSRFGSSFEGGRCECGAVYVYDSTGHNLGDAYIEALGLVCDDDMDKAWSLTPDKDYTVLELGYDRRRNKLGGDRKPRKNSPVYLFLLLKKPR
jgi:hypothetical protein